MLSFLSGRPRREILEETAQRTQGQSTPLGQQLAQAAGGGGGLVVGGATLGTGRGLSGGRVGGALLFKGIKALVQSPRWKTVSAVQEKPAGGCDRKRTRGCGGESSKCYTIGRTGGVETIMAGLTDQQKLFCREYLVDGCATQAAIRAGYSKTSAAPTSSRIMARPAIKAHIAELGLEIKSKHILSVTETLERISAEAVNMRHRPADRLKALELLAKHHGLLSGAPRDWQAWRLREAERRRDRRRDHGSGRAARGRETGGELMIMITDVAVDNDIMVAVHPRLAARDGFTQSYRLRNHVMVRHPMRESAIPTDLSYRIHAHSMKC